MRENAERDRFFVRNDIIAPRSREAPEVFDRIPLLSRAVRFREEGAPTLVFGENNQFLYSNGTLWIEPETGRVLRTEFNVESPYIRSRVKARIVVTYAEGKNMKMLVPSLMDEHYESEFNTVDCKAYYSNFRPFEVEVKFEIHPPVQ